MTCQFTKMTSKYLMENAPNTMEKKCKSTESIDAAKFGNTEDTKVKDDMEGKDVSWSKRKTATLHTESIDVGKYQNAEDMEDKDVSPQ